VALGAQLDKLLNLRTLNLQGMCCCLVTVVHGKACTVVRACMHVYVCVCVCVCVCVLVSDDWDMVHEQSV